MVRLVEPVHASLAADFGAIKFAYLTNMKIGWRPEKKLSISDIAKHCHWELAFYLLPRKKHTAEGEE
jgi:hypothetical protein